MPTVHKRVMLNIPQDTLEKQEKIAKVEKRSMAQTCLMHIEAAVKLPKYKEILHTPEAKGDAVVEEMGLDKLSPERIQELQQLLGMLQKLKS
tara:strand:+ start:29 stop:304 length:276 start_codon:yes stop_codon:yes gene_type:complete